MDIKNKNIGIHISEDAVGRLKGAVVAIVHIDAAQQIGHADHLAAAFDNRPAITGGAGRRIFGADNVFLLVEIIEDAAVVEGMVAQCNDVRTGIEEILSRFGRKTAAVVVGILAVDYYKVGFKLASEGIEPCFHKLAARRSADIAYSKYSQNIVLLNLLTKIIFPVMIIRLNVRP